MCIDESSMSNQVQCIDNEFCPKWLYFVRITRRVNGSKCEIRNLDFKSFGELFRPTDSENIHLNQINFYGVKVSNNFDMSNLKLPIYFFDLNLTNFEPHQDLKDLWSLFIVLISILIILLLFFVFIYYQSILISRMILILIFILFVN